jgi:hypothetical protein
MKLIVLLKFSLVLVLLVVGTIFLLEGLGADITALKYEGLEGHGVPVGIALLLGGIALARLWKVRHTHTVVETRKVEPTRSNRNVVTTAKITRTNVQFMPRIPRDQTDNDQRKQ